MLDIGGLSNPRSQAQRVRPLTWGRVVLQMRARAYRPADFTRLLLCGSLLYSLSPADLVWSRGADRERGGYGSYSSYGAPVERPVLPNPGEGVAAVGEVVVSTAPSFEVQLAQAQQLLGRALVDSEGAVLGTVRGIARSKEGEVGLQAIVALAGFLGLDKKHVLVPLEQLVPQPGQAEQLQVSTSIDPETLNQMLEYRPEQFDLVLPAAR